MKKIFSIESIYILLVILIQLRDIFYPDGGTIPKIIIGTFIFVSLIFTIYANTHYKLLVYFKGLNLLLIVLSLYSIIHIITTNADYIISDDREISSSAILQLIYISLLPVYAFYVLTINNRLSLKSIQRISILFLLISIFKFIAFYATNAKEVMLGEATNNVGYLFVGIISLLVFFNNKPILQYGLLVVCMIFIVLSMKRGAILVASCSLIPFVLLQWKKSNHNKRAALSLLIIVFFIVGIYFIRYLLQTSDYFIARIAATMEGNSSLRDELYTDLWIHFTNHTSVIKQLFGGGTNYTLQITDNFAHNDWLEILINQGIFGVLIYIIYWIDFWRTQKDCNHIPELNTTKIGLLVCFIASGLMTLFSMSYSNLPAGLTMTLGICLGQISIYKSGEKVLS